MEYSWSYQLDYPTLRWMSELKPIQNYQRCDVTSPYILGSGLVASNDKLTQPLKQQRANNDCSYAQQNVVKANCSYENNCSQLQKLVANVMCNATQKSVAMLTKVRLC